MRTIEYTTRDRSNWNAGPWDNEPDKIQFPDKETGLPCLMHRSPLGNWCGYVGVTVDHPLFAKYWGDLYDPSTDAGADLEVHGGLTYSDFCQQTDDESQGICHLPDNDEPYHVWWFGFDCAHGYDSGPSKEFPALGDQQEYRDVAYVKKECARLAKQLASI